MDIKEIRRHHLSQLIAAAGTAEAVGKRANIGPVYLRQIKGEYRNMGSSTARKLEKAFGLPHGYMDQIEAQQTARPISGSIAEQRADYQLRPTSIAGREVPIISWVKAGEFCEAIDNFQPGDFDESCTCPEKCGRSTFGLEVIGDSMFPEYREGEIIFVDPDVSAKHNDDVVVRTPDGRATFKRLQLTPDGTYLLALNPNHPDRKIFIPDDTHICGVVIGSYMKRR